MCASCDPNSTHPAPHRRTAKDENTRAGGQVRLCASRPASRVLSSLTVTYSPLLVCARSRSPALSMLLFLLQMAPQRSTAQPRLTRNRYNRLHNAAPHGSGSTDPHLVRLDSGGLPGSSGAVMGFIWPKSTELLEVLNSTPLQTSSTRELAQPTYSGLEPTLRWRRTS